MCGIAGMIRFDGAPIDRQRLALARDVLRHRGPDDAGAWFNESATVGLAATRLAILDPTLAGHQPMSRRGGRYHLVHNGEIYNFRALRADLGELGEDFSTNSDTEVLLAACIRWGPQAVHRLNGMWAFAFFDAQANQGFLARDRFGVKPLYWTGDAKRLAFASELRPLAVLCEFDRSLDSTALVEHLSFGYISGEKTIYQAAHRLQPGHYLPFDSNSTGNPIRYYDPVAAAAAPLVDTDSPRAETAHTARENKREGKQSYADRCAQVRRTLSEAVVCRRVSDVPIGAFLSGGLDSSIIVAHLFAAMGRPIQTFSVGFDRQANYDETSFARLVAARFGTDHHELILSERDVLDAIPAILDHLGEPFGDSSIIPTALLSRFARQHVTVALSGDGGDELFGGYWRYMAHDSLRTYQRIPKLLRRLLIEPLAARMGSSKSSPTSDRLRQFRKLLRGDRTSSDVLSRHVAWSRILAPEAATIGLEGKSGALLAAVESETVRRAEALTAGMNGAEPLNRVLASDLQHQLPADMLQKVDLASMMHSLEVRTPFLDPAVVELALSLPSEFKIKSGIRKRILIDAYRGHLPDEILDRPKKGFEVPIGEYFRGPLREMFQSTVTRDVVESFGLLSYDGIKNVFEDHLASRNEHADVLFALLSLCWWTRRRG